MEKITDRYGIKERNSRSKCQPQITISCEAFLFGQLRVLFAWPVSWPPAYRTRELELIYRGNDF